MRIRRSVVTFAVVSLALTMFLRVISYAPEDPSPDEVREIVSAIVEGLERVHGLEFAAVDCLDSWDVCLESQDVGAVVVAEAFGLVLPDGFQAEEFACDFLSARIVCEGQWVRQDVVVYGIFGFPARSSDGATTIINDAGVSVYVSVSSWAGGLWDRLDLPWW